MKQTTPTIVLTGGGSGGHITPLLSLARELKTQAPDWQLVYIGSKGDKFDSFQQSAHDFDFTAFIKAGKFRRYHTLKFAGGIFYPDIFIKNLIDSFRFPGNVFAAYKILRKFRPSAVFSKGGFVALPVGIAAHWLKIPLVTHDSDMVPGLTNRILGRWATAQATGMPPELFDYPKAKLHYVGIPLDERVKKVTPGAQRKVKQALGFDTDSQVLLVAGGSAGSIQLNEVMTSIAEELLSNNLALRLIHLSGIEHEASVKEAYHRLPKGDQKRVLVAGYSQDFYDLVAAADLIITRAGATTLAQLAAAGKACILVPGSHLAGGHQIKNAEWLMANDAAAIAPDNVQPDEMLALINGLLANDHRRFELSRNLYATAKPDAAKDLANLILKTAGRQ
jgi:UDP-N-acetylglucosamine--N-acetylmuramyl-(pentapeptide) pyrophosphoryl-undecaprenol N-acetylglucosamine transferase